MTKRTGAKATSRASTSKKKKSAAKRPAVKKTTARKSTSGKASSRKATTKKAGARKAATKKKTVKKQSASKTRSKAGAPKKKSAPKATGAAKSASKSPSKKKSPATKTEAKAPAKKSSKRGKSSARPATPAQANGDTASHREQGSLSDARAAASRLAAAAGLPTLKIRSLPGMEQTTDEPRLTKSPLGKRELDKYRKILLLKRAQVAGDVTDMELEALGGGKDALSSLPQHMADQGSDAYDQSLSLGLAASQRELLREIDAALERIDKGAYGICEALGKAINTERLEATPWTRYSVEGARMMDRGRGRS